VGAALGVGAAVGSSLLSEVETVSILNDGFGLVRSIEAEPAAGVDEARITPVSVEG
jgi:hypothetical protein